jgi:hypothetical protein
MRSKARHSDENDAHHRRPDENRETEVRSFGRDDELPDHKAVAIRHLTEQDAAL